MTSQSEPNSRLETHQSEAPKIVPRPPWYQFATELSFADKLCLCYAIVLNIAGQYAIPHPKQAMALGYIAILSLFYATNLIIIRGHFLPARIFTPALYRINQIVVITFSYLAFEVYLPVVRHTALDDILYRTDLSLFGMEPAVWFDRHLNGFWSEWLSFYYYGFFFILSGYTLGVLFLGRSQRLISEYVLGMVCVYVLGQIGYLLVPGYGPMYLLQDQFQHEFGPGIWWNITDALVKSGGAAKDIFPSLHTAVMSYLAMFTLRYRHIAPYRQLWPLMCFFVANIVLATMFQRWHYLVDVVAGLSLATAASIFASWYTPIELQLRKAKGLGVPIPRWNSRY